MKRDFSLEKQGYSKKEVDGYISQLNSEYAGQIEKLTDAFNDLKARLFAVQDELKEYQQKDTQISGALVAAVQTAQKIESSSKNIYDLEIQRVRVLYNRWEIFLNELIEKYPLLKDKFDEKKILKIFNDNIERTIQENFSSVNGEVTDKASLQNLIKKMSRANITPDKVTNYQRMESQKIINRKTKPKDKTLKKFKRDVNLIEEKKRLGNFKVKIKPISADVKLDKNDEYENLVDKFLSENQPMENISGYEKAIVRKKVSKTGFDLEEALNPKENLEEIMKAFDFFEQE